jgi:hypothetical protein
MREKPTNTPVIHSVYYLCIPQNALGTLPDDGNVMPKLPYIINKLME